MYLTVTLNPALDKIYTVPGFHPGGVHTPSAVTVLAGGKGINVARQLHRLGERVKSIGLVAGYTGKAIVDSLEREGIPHDFVDAPGEARTCIAVLDPAVSFSTEINEVGPQVGEKQWAQFTRRFSHHLADAVGVVVAGRLPPGVSDEAYRELIEMARSDGKLVALDTVEPALRHGLLAGPTIAKPNQEEAEALLGYSLADPATWPGALDALLEFGLEAAAITFGSGGAIAAVREGAQRHFRLTSPEVTTLSTIGCGDAFLGAWLSARGKGQDWIQAAVSGVAAGAANAMQYGSGQALPEQIANLAGGVIVTPL